MLKVTCVLRSIEVHPFLCIATNVAGRFGWRACARTHTHTNTQAHTHTQPVRLDTHTQPVRLNTHTHTQPVRLYTHTTFALGHARGAITKRFCKFVFFCISNFVFAFTNLLSNANGATKRKHTSKTHFRKYKITFFNEFGAKRPKLCTKRGYVIAWLLTLRVQTT